MHTSQEGRQNRVRFVSKVLRKTFEPPRVSNTWNKEIKVKFNYTDVMAEAKSIRLSPEGHAIRRKEGSLIKEYQNVA